MEKPAESLTIADLLECPLWEFTGDDSELARPLRTSDPVGENFGGLLAADFVSPQGKRWIGTVGAEPPGPTLWSNSPTIWLNAPAGELSDDPALKGYNPVVCETSTGVKFSLPDAKHLPDERAREIARAAYRLLGVAGPEEFFPLAVTPRHPVRRWSGAAMLDGFLRPTTLNGQPGPIR